MFKNFDLLSTEIAHSIRATHAILDGEIVCLDADSNFCKLLFRREWPYFYAKWSSGSAREARAIFHSHCVNRQPLPSIASAPA